MKEVTGHLEDELPVDEYDDLEDEEDTCFGSNDLDEGYQLKLKFMDDVVRKDTEEMDK